MDVVEGRITLDEFVSELSIDDLIHLLGGQPNTGVANTCLLYTSLWNTHAVSCNIFHFYIITECSFDLRIPRFELIRIMN